MQLARNGVADVRHLAAVGLGDRLDRLRPPPAGLERGSADIVPGDLDEVDSPVVERAGLLRVVEALGLVRHGCLLFVSYPCPEHAIRNDVPRARPRSGKITDSGARGPASVSAPIDFRGVGQR